MYLLTELDGVAPLVRDPAVGPLKNQQISQNFLYIATTFEPIMWLADLVKARGCSTNTNAMSIQ